MKGSIFYLNFKTDGAGYIKISEPVGMDASEFSLKQDDKRLGRDVLFAGGNAKLEFSRLKHPEAFHIIQRYFEMYGFESDVDLIIDFGGTGNMIIIGNLDFATAENNVLELFKCDVILDSKQAIIKRRNEIKTDLFSSLTLDNNAITPVNTSKILLKSVPTYTVSQWSQPNPQIVETGGIGGVTTRFFNHASRVDKSEIKNTLSFIPGFGNRRDFGYIEAIDTVQNGTLTIRNLTVKTREIASSYPLGQGSVAMYFFIGDANVEPTNYFNNRVFYFPFFGTPENYEQQINNREFVFENININRGQRLYLWFEAFTDTQNTTYILRTTITSMEVEIKGSSVSYDTVNPGIRLIDAIRYNLASISGLNVSFPMAESGGYLYNQFIFNGNLLRAIQTVPFYLTFKMIQEWFPELNLDYEIESNGTVFIGSYEDFYPNREIAVFTKTQFSNYNKTFNEKFKINELSFAYKNYRSQKEADTENGNDEVHGEAQFAILNEKVENQKEISVGFYRSALLIEDNRRKAMSTPKSTATQDDDKIAIIDVYPSELIEETLIERNENSFLQHSYDTVTGKLILRNDGSFNFELLGIVVDAFIPFIITAPQPNHGTYFVDQVSSNYLVLTPDFNPNNPASAANDGQRFTNYTYNIPVSTLAGMNWSNEGFSLIENITASDNYYNLRFTLKRNIIAGYSDYLATCNLYNQAEIKNTFYKNNPNCVTVYEGDSVREGDSINPKSPILSPYIHELTFLTDFGTYKDIENKMRSSQRGFIRCFDARGNVLKVYPKEMKFQQSFEVLGELSVIGEEKLQTQLINIVNVNPDFITINDEYMVTRVIYEEKNDYFYIKDQNGLLLYNGVFFDRISINGAISESKAELIEWLNLLT